MTDKVEGHWWCSNCQREKSPMQVTFEEHCTICDHAVQWIEETSPATDEKYIDRLCFADSQLGMEAWVYWSNKAATPCQSCEGLVKALENIVEHWQQGGTTLHWVQDLDTARQALSEHRKNMEK